MQRFELITQVAAPPERVFEVLTDHEGMVRWSDAREVVLRHPGDPPPNGVGAVRVVRAGGIAVEEEIVAFDPPKRMEYRVTAGMPIRDHHGEVRLDPDGEGTRLCWRVRFRPLVPGTGWLLRRLLGAAVNRLMTQLGRYAEGGTDPTSPSP